MPPDGPFIEREREGERGREREMEGDGGRERSSGVVGTALKK